MTATENRPAHIAALDTSLSASIEEAKVRDQQIADFLDQNLEILDQARALESGRAAAYKALRDTHEAINSLGYVPQVDIDDMGYSWEGDIEAARARSEESDPEGEAPAEGE